MHEISLLEQVRDILLEHSISQDFTKVSQVTLEVGALSCVEEEALRFGFDVVMQGSLAEGAELTIICINGLGFCQVCQQSVSIQSLHDPCVLCGSFGVKVVQGEEMRIKDLQVVVHSA